MRMNILREGSILQILPTPVAVLMGASRLLAALSVNGHPSGQNQSSNLYRDQRSQQIRQVLVQHPAQMHTAIDFPAPLTYKKTEKLVQRVMRLRALMAESAAYRKWQKCATASLEKSYPRDSNLEMIDSKKT